MAAASTTEQWIQVYDQHPPITPMQQFSDPTHHHVVSKMSSPSSSSSMILSSNISPKGSSTVSKLLTKRRSRASKRTPTTLINANTSNFRALVQQFTGCPTTPMSFGVPFKGPITLNFQRGRREMQIHHNTTTTRSYNDNNNQVLHHHHHQQEQQQQQQVLLQEQQNVDDYMMMKGITSGLDDPTNYSSGISSSSSGMEISDPIGFDGLMDSDDFSLHDLIAMNNAFSNDIGYFV